MSPEATNMRSVRCPICRKVAADDYRPFCSKRCADIDLGKWFTGSYSVAGRLEDEGSGIAANDDADPSEEDSQKR